MDNGLVDPFICRSIKARVGSLIWLDGVPRLLDELKINLNLKNIADRQRNYYFRNSESWGLVWNYGHRGAGNELVRLRDIPKVSILKSTNGEAAVLRSGASSAQLEGTYSISVVVPLMLVCSQSIPSHVILPYLSSWYKFRLCGIQFYRDCTYFVYVWRDLTQ